MKGRWQVCEAGMFAFAGKRVWQSAGAEAVQGI